MSPASRGVKRAFTACAERNDEVLRIRRAIYIAAAAAILLLSGLIGFGGSSEAWRVPAQMAFGLTMVLFLWLLLGALTERVPDVGQYIDEARESGRRTRSDALVGTRKPR